MNYCINRLLQTSLNDVSQFTIFKKHQESMVLKISDKNLVFTYKLTSSCIHFLIGSNNSNEITLLIKQLYSVVVSICYPNILRSHLNIRRIVKLSSFFSL